MDRCAIHTTIERTTLVVIFLSARCWNFTFCEPHLSYLARRNVPALRLRSRKAPGLRPGPRKA